MQHRSGAAAIVIIVGLVVVALLAFGVFYLVSDPFSTKVDDAISGATEWTPENIQANPVGYLSWASKQVAGTEQKLKASQLSLTTKRNQARRKLEKAEAEMSTYQAFLDEAKESYRAAKTADTWPVTVRSKQLDEADLKRLVVDANSKHQNQKEMHAAFTRTLGIIETKLSELAAKLTEVQKMKNKLETDLEVAKTNQTVAGLDDIDDRVGAIIDTSNALAGTTTDEISLDEMIIPSGQQRVDTEFEAIMGE
ncbi:MAG: hypothetical protein ACOCYP_02680 [Planctomycetota bacterium]